MAQQPIIQFHEEITLIVNDWNVQVSLYVRNKIHAEKWRNCYLFRNYLSCSHFRKLLFLYGVNNHTRGE
jgi:hypothetical protein